MLIENQNVVSPEVARLYSPLSLAFLGDAVYGLMVRSHLSGHGSIPAKLSHRLSKKFVSADNQSKICDLLIPLLNEEESDIFRRARNSKPPSRARNMSSADYMKATALESLFGFLYLTGQHERLGELFCVIIDEYEEATTDITKK